MLNIYTIILFFFDISCVDNIYPKTGKTIVVVAENNGAAFKYYKLAADNGISKAQIRVMEMCLNKANSKDLSITSSSAIS